VFLDETSAAIELTGRYARAPRARRAVGHVPRNYGRHTTLLAVLTPRGLDAPLVLDGALDTAVFVAYVAQFLVPTLRPGQIVILDNLSCHHAAAAAAARARAGCRFWFLPSYSPDFNPIELAFAKLKAALRKAAARTQAALEHAITEALEAITADDARHWYRHCGYPLSASIPS
jgi:transposase